jgi:hypothetical protein
MRRRSVGVSPKSDKELKEYEKKKQILQILIHVT